MPPDLRPELIADVSGRRDEWRWWSPVVKAPEVGSLEINLSSSSY